MAKGKRGSADEWGERTAKLDDDFISDSPETLKKRAMDLLRAISLETLASAARTGGEAPFEIAAAFRKASREANLGYGPAARLLVLLGDQEAKGAARNALRAPQAEKSLAKLSRVRARELYERLAQLPSSLRLMPREPREMADIERAALGRLPRQHDKGEKTSDELYTLESFLGFGPVGETWSAAGRDGERWAVKFFFLDRARKDLGEEYSKLLELNESFEDFAPTMIRARRGNTRADPPYLALELAENGSLGGWMGRAGDLSASRRLSILSNPLLALAEIHRRGLAHRGVKPSNILIDSERRARLADLGLARFDAERAQPSGSESAKLCDAPEIRRGEVARDDAAGLKKADVYGFGATLAQFLAGDPGFDPAAAGALKNVPRKVRKLLERCLAPDPADRFADAGEVVDYLREIGFWNEGGRLDDDDGEGSSSGGKRVALMFAAAVSGAVALWLALMALLFSEPPEPSPGPKAIGATASPSPVPASAGPLPDNGG